MGIKRTPGREGVHPPVGDETTKPSTKPKQATGSDRKAGSQAKSSTSDSVGRARSSNPYAHIGPKVDTGLRKPQGTPGTDTKNVAEAAVSARGIDGVDLGKLQDLTPKRLDNQWNIGNPFDASEMLHRFTQFQSNYIRSEMESIPQLALWEDCLDHTYDNADLALQSLKQLASGVGEAEFAEACQTMFREGQDGLTIRGVTFYDPAILQAAQTIRAARNPLSTRESNTLSLTFSDRPKARFSKDDLRAILNVNQTRNSKGLDLIDEAFVALTAHEPGFEETITKAVNNSPQRGGLHVEFREGVLAVHPNASMARALRMIVYKDKPEKIESLHDRAILQDVLKEAGGSDNLKMDEATVQLIGREMIRVEKEARDNAEVALDAFPDTPEELGRLAREVLTASEANGEFKTPAPEGLQPFIQNGELVRALRVLASEVDSPEVLPGSHVGLASELNAQDRGTTPYSVKMLETIVTINKESGEVDSKSQLKRLAEGYGITLDPQKTFQESVGDIQAQLAQLVEDYSEIADALAGFDETIGREAPVGDYVSLTESRRKTITPKLLLQLESSSQLAKDYAAAGKWLEANAELKNLKVVLTTLDADYSFEALDKLDLGNTVDALEEVASAAEEANQWSALDYVFSILSLGIFYLYKTRNPAGGQASVQSGEKAEKLQAQVGELKKNASRSDTARLLRLRDTLRNQIEPNVHDLAGRDFLDFYETHLDAAIYRNMKTDITDEITKQLAFLEEGGAKMQSTFGVGAGWGMFGAKGKVGVSMSLAVTGNDDRRVREGKSLNLSIGVGGDVGIASITGSLGAGGKLGKTFKSVKDFVEYHSDDILLATLRGIPNIEESLGDRATMRRAAELESLSQDQVARFNYLARGMGVIGEGEGLLTHSTTKPVPSQSKTISGKAGLSAGFGINDVVGISAGITGTAARTNFYKRLNLLDYLKGNLDNLGEVQTFSDRRNLSIRDYPEYETIDDFSNRISQLSNREDRIGAVLDSMSRIAGEFTNYCNTLKNYDAAKKPWSAIYKSPMERNLQGIKHDYQNSRGTDNRTDYTRACVGTYAHLIKLLGDNCTPEELQALDLSAFDELFQIPPIKLSESQRNQLHQRITKTGTAKSLAFSLGTELKLAGLSGEITGKIDEIKNNSNPDNDGVYFNLSLTGTGEIQKILPAIMTAVENANPSLMTDPESLVGVVKEALKEAVGGNVPGIPGVSVGWDASVSATVEMNFIKSHKIALQYLRVTGGSGVGVSVSDIPLGAVSASVTAKFATSQQLFELIGADTVSYVQTQFNGFKLAGGDWQTGWKDWCLKGQNKNQMWRLAKKMGDERSNANQELRDLKASLSEEDLPVYQELESFLYETRRADKAKMTDKKVAEFGRLLGEVIIASKGAGGLARGRLMEQGWKTIED